jgi:hypothetical protein
VISAETPHARQASPHGNARRGGASWQLAASVACSGLADKQGRRGGVQNPGDA